MDAKISALPTSTTPSVTDIIPIASAGVTKGLTVGSLAMNLPNLGNKGITKNAVTTASSSAIPLTGTIILLPESMLPYTLANGVSGQEIVLVSAGPNTVNISSGYVPTLVLTTDTVATLLFVGTKWLAK